VYLAIFLSFDNENEVKYKNPNWITNKFEHYQSLIS